MQASKFPLAEAAPWPDEVVREVPLPNGAARRRVFDLGGRLRRELWPDGTALRFRYDLQGNLKAADHSGGERVTYRVAPAEWQTTAGRVTTTIRIEDGFPAAITTAVDGYSWTVEYRRAADGAVEGIRYPGAAEWLAVERSSGSVALRCGARTYCEARRAADSTTIGFVTGAKTIETFGEGQPPRLGRVAAVDRAGATVVDLALRYNAEGRIAAAGAATIAYDAAGHLAAWESGGQRRVYRYDAAGRLVAIETGGETQTLRYASGPVLSGLQGSSATVRFTADTIGRRVARHAAAGTTRYSYDLFGQLTRVELPSGSVVGYLYDGFGRLAARSVDGALTYVVHGVDGQRIAEADASGAIVRSYLWLGAQCVGRIDGAVGGALAQTFHRGPAGQLSASGDAAGALVAEPAHDPFGAQAAIRDGVPGFAGLWGDPLTGLLHAGARWLDPAVAQFIAPDTWFGDAANPPLPQPLGGTLRAMPGGTGRTFTAAEAYAWCAYDPVNASDPSGHNWLGLIWSTISAFLWEMQLTSLSLQMEVINILIWILETFPLFRMIWDSDGYRDTAIYNLAPPVASYRLMVPFALPLNGMLRFHDRGWTLGSVIWVRGDKWRTVENTSKRDLLICDNAATFRAAVDEAAADSYRVRSPNAVAGGTVSAIGTPRAEITGITLTTPAGAALTDIFAADDFVALRLTGATTDEIRQIDTLGPAARMVLKGPALPANFAAQPVTVTRLDRSIVHISGGGKGLARTITFVRGQAIHFVRATPESYLPDSGLNADELLPAGIRNVKRGTLPVEQSVIRLAQDSDRTGYAGNDVVRLLSAATYYARRVTALPGTRDLALDTPLPNGAHTGVEIARLTPDGAAAANQNGAGDRVNAGTLIALQPRDGVAVTSGATTERRIVTSLRLDCTIAAVPAALRGAAVKVDLLQADATVLAGGTVAGPTTITTDAGQAGRFSVDQPIRVAAGATNAFNVVAGVDAAANSLTLREPLPGARFGSGTAVQVTLLAVPGPNNTFDADQITPAGDHVLVQAPTGSAIGLNGVLRIRLAADTAGGAVRQVGTAPTIVAVLDSALPAAFTSGLSVQRLAPDAASVRTNASAPQLRPRIQLTGANPYAVGNQLHLRANNEEAWGEVAVIDGTNVILTTPIDFTIDPAVTVQVVAPSGVRNANAHLDEGLILIPSDPDADPLTRRAAFENHEMRHVWQGAVWGPLLLSLPIPWLFNMGFSASDSAHSGSQVMRHIGLGGLDTLFAGLVWLIGGREAPTQLEGEVTGAERKLVQFAADATNLGKFGADSNLSVIKGDYEAFNIVDALDTGAHTVKLRFALEQEHFAVGDRVRLTVSPFEEIRKQVNTWFSLNLEQLWGQHIPVAWGRALSKLLNRDSWFPGLGLYPLSLLVAGFNENRLPNEQDAAYHSGDLYSSIVLSKPKTIFVGQFARLFGFIHPRSSGDGRAGISEAGVLSVLSVQLPAGVAATSVAGSVPTGANMVRFRENYYIPLTDRIENAVGAFFTTSAPGTYRLITPDQLGADVKVVFGFAFDVDFLELSEVVVQALTVTPDVTQPIWETEVVTFTVGGDTGAEYRLRFPPASAANRGRTDGLVYTAPRLPSAAVSDTQALEITAVYAADNPVFRGPGQPDSDRLLAEQRTTLCQAFTLTINALVPPTVGPVAAGSVTDFTMPIAPRAVRVLPAPAGVGGIPAIMNLGGRPANLKFVAPTTVAAATTLHCELEFGDGGDPLFQRTVTFDVVVNPA